MERVELIDFEHTECDVCSEPAVLVYKKTRFERVPYCREHWMEVRCDMLKKLYYVMCEEDGDGKG